MSASWITGAEVRYDSKNRKVDANGVPIDARERAQYELEQQLAAVQAQVTAVQAQLDTEIANRDRSLKLSAYLVVALEQLVNAKAGAPTINGTTQVVQIGGIVAVINPFEGNLTFSDASGRVKDTVTVHFSREGKLSGDARRSLRGFVTDVTDPIPGTDFFDGSNADDDIRVSDAFPTNGDVSAHAATNPPNWDKV